MGLGYCRVYFDIGWGRIFLAVEGCGKILLTRLVSYNCGDRCLRALVRADSTVRQCLSPSRVLSLGRHSFSERTFLSYNRPLPLFYVTTAVLLYHLIGFLRKYKLLRVKFTNGIHHLTGQSEVLLVNCYRKVKLIKSPSLCDPAGPWNLHRSGSQKKCWVFSKLYLYKYFTPNVWISSPHRAF